MNSEKKEPGRKESSNLTSERDSGHQEQQGLGWGYTPSQERRILRKEGKWLQANPASHHSLA